MALTELARYVPRVHHHNRYLRSGLRAQRHEAEARAPATEPQPEGSEPLG